MVAPAERRSERGPGSEQALAGAAAEVIAERGIAGASFQRIGERAGTSRGLPTHHFGSKEALVARVAQQAQDHVQRIMGEALRASTDRPQDLSGLDLVRGLVETYLRLFEDPTPDERALIVMWGATFPSETTIDGMLEADARSYEGWTGHFAHGQHDGSIRADLDTDAAAVILHGMLRGVVALVLTGSAPVDLATIRRSVDSWLEHALAPRSVGEPAPS